MKGNTMHDYGPARIRAAKRLRASSFDPTGGNCDHWRLHPKKETVIMEAGGPGCVRHIWFTCGARDRHHLRKIILRMYWDGADSPSVLTPLGDFFGLGHCIYQPYETPWLSASASGGRALNCWFPMPFARGARITVESQCDEDPFPFFVYIDYETGEAPPDDVGRFHAHWRREWPTRPDDDRANVTGDGNYLLADITGRGQYVGTILNVDSPSLVWFGEGDDMFFIDGEGWPPSCHGTGTEDYFNTAWCPREHSVGPHHGVIITGHPHSSGFQFLGKSTYYRFHTGDPVTFTRSLRASIEHGHANEFVGDWSSTAFWYGLAKSAPLPELPPVSERLPLPELSLETGALIETPHKSLSYFPGVGSPEAKAACDALVNSLAEKWSAGELDETSAREWSADLWRKHAQARRQYLAASGREVVVPRAAAGKAPSDVAAVLSLDNIHGSRHKAPRTGEVRMAFDNEGLLLSGSFEIARREPPGFMYDVIDVYLAEEDWGERFAAVSTNPSRPFAKCCEHRPGMAGGWGGLEDVAGDSPAVTVEVGDNEWTFETRVPWALLGITPEAGKRIDCNIDRWNYQDHPWWASWALTPHHYYHPKMGGVLVLG